MTRRVRPRARRRPIWIAAGGVALLAAGIVIAPSGVAIGASDDLAFGQVVVDSNKNGVVDAGPTGANDTPLAGVAVTLRGTNPDHAGWTVTTDTAGNWSFPAATDRSVSPGPFRVTIDVAGVNGDAYVTPDALDPVYSQPSPGVNDFARVAGEGNTQRAVSAPIAAGASSVRLNALVYPTWSTTIIALSDPEGYGGKAVYTGTAPFDGDDEPGHDSSFGDARVRTTDLVDYNWSITASAEQDLGAEFRAWFEQTITPGPDAVVTFGQISDACVAANSTITALPSGAVLPPRVDPPADTTSVTLRCDLGPMSTAAAQTTLDSQVFVSGSSRNGATFTTTARTYGATAAGVTTARPDATELLGPFEITAAPRYDIEKQRPFTFGLGSRVVDGVPTYGWELYYSVQISTDRRSGVEAMAQPVTFEDSLWATTTDGRATMQPDFPWEVLSCAPDVGNNSIGPGNTTVYGAIGGPDTLGRGVSTAENSVVDSGTCSFERVGDPATGNYRFTLDGIDTSGSSYPTTAKDGSALAANRFYVAAYAIKVFVPYEAVDAMDGVPGDVAGSVRISNRVGDFSPVGLSGAKNHGSGFEPGYCQAGPNTDASTKCDRMPNNDGSNNVARSIDLVINPGTWSKTLASPSNTWMFRNSPLPEAGGFGSGAGQVQPGQTFASIVAARPVFDTRDLQMCDVWDGTMMRLAPLRDISTTNDNPADPVWNNAYSAVSTTVPGFGEVDRSKMPAFQGNVTIRYAHVDLIGDDPYVGAFDQAHNRWLGVWTAQQRAASGPGIACGDPRVTWHDDPTEVEGGIDAVNAAWMQTKPGYVQPGATTLNWMIGLQQRDSFLGGPHDGARIPEYTVAANFANITADTFGAWRTANDFVPGAGTTGGSTWADRRASSMGDRWTVVRAQMAITKRTVDGVVDGVAATGAADVGSTGSAKAGTPVIWEVAPSLTAVGDNPAPVRDVTVTDTLPKGADYDHAATVALVGDRAPTSYRVNPNGTTTLVWQLGALTPNRAITPLRVVTHIDALLPNNTQLVNRVGITAAGIVPFAPSHNAEHTVTVSQPGSLQVRKSVDHVLDLQDLDQVFTLELRNFAQALRVQAPTIIDVLPYVGDATNDAQVNRNPASAFVGTTRLRAAPQAFLADGTTVAKGTFFYTTDAPGTVSQDLNHDDTTWSAQFTPQATAWKFVAEDALGIASAGATSGLKIVYTMDQRGNAAGNLYANRFTAFSETFRQNSAYQMLTSNQVTVRVVGFSLGDLVWLDLDDDGRYTPGVDQPAPAGVTVEVRTADGETVAQTTTNDDGRWVVNDLPAGEYHAVLPASQFATGGALAGYAAQPRGYQADPNDNVNEGADHNGAAQQGGGVRTGDIRLAATVVGSTITGNGPLGDNTGNLPVTPGTTDDFTNFTLDIALRPVPGYTFTKTAAPGTRAPIAPGGTITYTLTGSNTGKTPLDVRISDDLTDVLLHAEITSVPVATITGVDDTTVPMVEVDGNRLSWAGTLAPGQTVQVVYAVTVNDDAAGSTVVNSASSSATPPHDPPITPDEVTTRHPVPGYVFTKRNVLPGDGNAVAAGGSIRYLLEGVNAGASVLAPVVVTDDLSRVLGDASLTGAPVAVIVRDGVSRPADREPGLAGTTLSWTGVLQPGERVRITYTVTVGPDAAGAVIDNRAHSSATPPGLPPITPGEVTTVNPVPGYTLAKTADPPTATAVEAGSAITYTVTGTNTGATRLEPVTVTDDLAKVLKHADVTVSAVATIDGVESVPQPVIEDTTLSWTGALEVGQAVVITYTVTVHDDAAGVILTNRVTSSATPPGLPPITPEEAETWHPTPGYTFAKVADPATGSAVRIGDVITYTIAGTNAGAAPLETVLITDDLSKVLAHGEIVQAPTATIVGPGSDVAAPVIDGSTLTWTGALAPGEQVLVVYAVKVGAGAEGSTIRNHAFSSATPPGLPPITPPEVRTEHPVAGYALSKSADPASGSEVAPGSTIRYTVIGENTGAAVLQDVLVEDDLSRVLPHATLLGAPTAEIVSADGAVTAAAAPTLHGTVLTWGGSLQVGERVRLVYAVVVDEHARGVSIGNTATSIAVTPGVPPITPPPVTTEHGVPVPPTGLPLTGAAVPVLALSLGGLVLVAGAGLLLIRRRSVTRG